MSQHKLSTRNLNGRLERFMWNADWMIGYRIVTELNYELEAMLRWRRMAWCNEDYPSLTRQCMGTASAE
jgi:hypothetical protein